MQTCAALGGAALAVKPLQLLNGGIGMSRLQVDSPLARSLLLHASI